MKIIMGFILPGAMLVIFAFFAGAQKNPTLGLFSFLCFFVTGVTLIMEGLRRRKQP